VRACHRPACHAEPRAALLRILRGEDTEPGATVFQVFTSTCETLQEPIIAEIEFELDIEGRKARGYVDGVFETRGSDFEPYHRSGASREHRAARGLQVRGGREIGRGWSKTEGPVRFVLPDSYGQFPPIHLCQSGIVR
jgi:hypothetical protein